jgi:hypothetical protein
LPAYIAVLIVEAECTSKARLELELRVPQARIMTIQKRNGQKRISTGLHKVKEA